jgi:hypothetical protein
MTAGCNCGRTWTGLSQAHCSSGCHEHFSSVTGFDRHRATGRCVPPEAVRRSDGGPYFKAVEGPFGVTWTRDDPAGHYRTDRTVASADAEETTR